MAGGSAALAVALSAVLPTAVAAPAAAPTLGSTSAAAVEALEPTPTPPVEPTPDPTVEPTPDPTVEPTPDPTVEPTPDPTVEPTPGPTTPQPTATRTPSPTATPIPPAKPVRPPGAPSYEAPADYFVPLSGGFLRSQIAEADRITAALSASTSKVAIATREMDKLAAKSNALLESLAAARETEIGAQQEAAQARADLAALDARLAEARAIVREWVFLVYSGGAGGSDVAYMIEAMASDVEDVGNPLGDLSYLTDQRTRAVDEVRVLTAEQVRLSSVLDAAASEAAAATRSIKDDSSALTDVVDEQRAKVDELRALQIAEVEKAGPVAAVLVGARTPEAKRAAQRLRDALRSANTELTDVGEPCTDDTTVYPNGLFPASALCPLWGAPGEMLSPAAAAAFNALSKAYAAQTGEPLCITDSYRSLAGQISAKARHGAFAATPGTSRHGLGRALDMCGGVQDFSSPAHRWMKQNGPLYGWFHPSWAAAGGSLPEPWHFEFAG
ncbi:hypothetical protein GCM10023168_18880 [Fodinibacter luteus]|uniref:D-alanyl-D-alanine carboxypeptidase-like core domain-containing protein n=1 Tax=Fodinibacter luteus TaxID=552064 RepID=A0ABP8KEC4_9MICO